MGGEGEVRRRGTRGGKKGGAVALILARLFAARHRVETTLKHIIGPDRNSRLDSNGVTDQV